jgi:hypothetical protein
MLWNGTRERRLALNEEMEAIHYGNKLYWERKNPTPAARAEYNFRNKRLEKIRAELEELRSA